ncbi:MAG: hypothetical protein IKN41_05040 [Candidatus Methanomethylophilaceae archaeon]|nr:hypothetical protein [Candidatus Methanomethylophilaceae archaeon]
MVVREDATHAVAVGAGEVADTAGCSSVLIIGTTTEISKIEESDSSGSGFDDVADADLLAGGDGVTAYIGNKRYLAVTATSDHDAFIVLLYDRHAPTS